MSVSRVRTKRSALRPMVAGASLLAMFVAVASTLLAWWGLREVAAAASRDAIQRATAVAKAGGQDVAVDAAAHFEGVARRAESLGERIASATRRTLDADASGAPESGTDLEPLAASGLSWRAPDQDGVYFVSPGAAPTPEQVARLTETARRLGPLLAGAIDSNAGFVHAAVWIDGVGLVAAASPADEPRLGARRLAPGFGPQSVAGGMPGGPRWVRAGERLAACRATSLVVPVRRGDAADAEALVVIDVSCASMEAELRRETGSSKIAAAVIAGDDDVLAATPDFPRRLGLARADSGDVLVALRKAVGLAAFSAPARGVDLRAPRFGVCAAGAPSASWNVVALQPTASEIAASASGVAAVAAVARRQTISFIALAIMFGGAAALGAFALAESLARRLRPILDGAAAHARGDLDHVVDATGEDEVGELALSLNATATRLRQNLGRLQESERRLSGLIESMGEGFIIADAEDRITFVNQRFAELVRRQPSAVIGRYVEELLVPDSLARYRAEGDRRVEGRASQYEATWQVFGGRHPRTIVSGMPMYDADGVYSGSFAVVTDVTDRTCAQEEQARSEKLRALGEMAGGVAHDFNNLLTVVLGNAQFLLLDDGLPEDVLRTLRAIEKSALDGTERVRRVTEFTKSRSVDANAVEVDVNVVLEAAIESARRKYAGFAKDQGVEYLVEVRRGSRRMVRGDPEELREALANLIDNAFEAMPKGGRIVAESFDRGEDAVGLRIEDTGIGMDDDVRNKAFDPFFTTKVVGRCAGLGLSITYGIVRAHAGRIDVKSAPGLGATFTIVLPAHARVEGGEDKPSVAPPKPRVLLVGLDARESEAVQRGLRELGVYVAQIASPQAALAILADGAIFNTLIVEHDMGASSGWSFARDARVLRVDLRILLLTAPGRPVDETQSRNAGIDRVLVRPFDARDLHAAIFSVLALPPARRIATETSTSKGRGGVESTETREVWGAADEPVAVADSGEPLADPASSD